MHSKSLEELNPYKFAFNTISSQIQKIENERNKLDESIQRFNSIDISKLESKIDELNIKIKTITSQNNDLKKQLDFLENVDSLLDPPIFLSLNPFDTIISFSARRFRKKARLDKIKSLQDKLIILEDNYSKALFARTYLIDDIEFKKELNLDQTVSNRDSFNNELNRLSVERSDLYKKFDRVESALKIFKEQFNTDYRLLEKNKSDIILAEKIGSELENSDKSGRWYIHQECEKQFGDSSPNRVLKKLNIEYRSKERNLKKLLDRAQHAVIKANISIEKLIIDGNNLCHRSSVDNREKSEFIGLQALIPLVKVLKEKYKVEVIFDNTIKRSLDLDNISASLNIKDVYIVNNKADEFILDLAKDKGSYIISNDKYSEYFDKLAVIEKRILNHEIFKNNLKIYDIDIDIDF